MNIKQFQKFQTLDESTKYYAQLFKKNRRKIKILVEWRNFFGIKLNSLQDRGLAFLINEVYRESSLLAPLILRRIKNNARRYGENYLAYLGSEVEKRYLTTQKRAILGMSNKDREVYSKNLKYTQESLEEFTRALTESKVIRAVFSVPDRFLPQWWPVAHPEYSLYHDEFIRSEIEKLNALEEAEESRKYRDAVVLKELLKTGCYPLMYQKWEKKLNHLIQSIQEEMGLRRKVFRSGKVAEFEKNNCKILILLKRQKRITGQLVSSKNKLYDYILDPQKRSKVSILIPGLDNLLTTEIRILQS